MVKHEGGILLLHTNLWLVFQPWFQLKKKIQQNLIAIVAKSTFNKQGFEGIAVLTVFKHNIMYLLIA